MLRVMELMIIAENICGVICMNNNGVLNTWLHPIMLDAFRG